MAIPDTNTFNLQNVVNEVAPISSDLSASFLAAIPAYFDSNYSGSKNSLLNFRNYKPTFVPTYGYMYNWYAASNANFAPSGWHVPTEAEITTLSNYVSGGVGVSIAGGKLKITGTTFWATENATDDYLFSAVGCGRRVSVFDSFRSVGYYWTSSNFFSNIAYSYQCNHSSTVLQAGTSYAAVKYLGAGVRLLKNDSTNPGTLTDYDGNTYPTVKIGNQVWTRQNWKCTRLNNGTLIPTVTNDASWIALTTLGKCAFDNNESYV